MGPPFLKESPAVKTYGNCRCSLKQRVDDTFSKYKMAETAETSSMKIKSVEPPPASTGRKVTMEDLFGTDHKNVNQNGFIPSCDIPKIQGEFGHRKRIKP